MSVALVHKTRLKFQSFYVLISFYFIGISRKDFAVNPPPITTRVLPRTHLGFTTPHRPLAVYKSTTNNGSIKKMSFQALRS